MRRHIHLMESVRSFENLHVDATVQANMERRQLGERFRVLEPAIPPLRPSSPNRVLIIVMGMMLGRGGRRSRRDRARGHRFLLSPASRPPGRTGDSGARRHPLDRARIGHGHARRRRLRMQDARRACSWPESGSWAAGVTYMYVNGAPGFVSIAAVAGETRVRPEAPAEGASLDRERSHRG